MAVDIAWLEMGEGKTIMDWIDTNEWAELNERARRLEEALKEYQHFNRILNDLDAYLIELGYWALGERVRKPIREMFGVK